MNGTGQALRQIGGPMVITCLRFATARGISDRLMLDRVLNNSVEFAHRRGEINALDDGTPWWPLIDICVVAGAIDWAVGRAAENGDPFRAVNAGPYDRDDEVRDLANAEAAAVPGTTVGITATAPADNRPGPVDVDRHASLVRDNPPQVTLALSIGDVVAGLRASPIPMPTTRR